MVAELVLVRRKHTSPAIEYEMKKLILASVAALMVVCAGWGVYFLWDARLWPFSTGTQDEAFLGATFGMSPQEVRRAVASTEPSC